MLCDTQSTLGTELDISTTGVKGNAIDLGVGYNIGAGANRPPYFVVTADTAITGTATLALYASDSATAVSSATKLMTIPVSAIAEGEILFAGILPIIPEAKGRYLVLSVDTIGTSADAPTGKVTAQIVNNPPFIHDYPAKR